MNVPRIASNHVSTPVRAGSDGSLTIGALARAAGTTADTIRFYEKSGLLPAAQRRNSGYRQYAQSDVRRVRFVRRARSLGFSLEEIRELLTLRIRRHRAAAQARRVAAARLAEIDARISQLQSLRAALGSLVDACPGEGHADECPILHAFESLEDMHMPYAAPADPREGDVPERRP